VSRRAALSVGGERRFHHLPLQGLTIVSETKVLDLCCGSGQATQYLVKYSQDVTGLDVSLVSLERAKRNVPQAQYVEALAESIPLCR
jgi:ubiquinone/menaquinone biosynthesis C-methylase UbiE